MSYQENLKFDPARFSGVVRLFPLPNLVLFPHVLQPLHIFEPRYCDMLEDALATDQMIAMAILSPGWESDYEGRPPVQPVACLGQIATHIRLPDNCHNLLLAGVARISLGPELMPTMTFRRAPAEIRADSYPSKYAPAKETLTRRLFQAFRQALPDNEEAQAPLAQLLDKDLDLGVLTDIIAYTLDLPVTHKAELLAECDVHARATRLLAHLAASSKVEAPTFPPGFSAN